MHENWLKLNDDKTEFIIFSITQNVQKVVATSVKVGGSHITSCREVRNTWYLV